jgi:hypothetical protein
MAQALGLASSVCPNPSIVSSRARARSRVIAIASWWVVSGSPVRLITKMVLAVGRFHGPLYRSWAAVAGHRAHGSAVQAKYSPYPPARARAIRAAAALRTATRPATATVSRIHFMAPP